ncbi:hypothetical protein A2334_05905 [Candidatus Roizmanbacteria bacterium RIFOXYB2_FULL_38_10]|uniref:Transglutaminase-like domain-containing protein n=1 Tax=Candidatus Roizmanbacteria bacterium RIFOXYD1_FULL_38_12 TaxID=1802093 RepID=A0A1F7L0T2_9BACT|nr:MAG: hypothetical protein A3K47_03025 [Candidatus Roizmanbacteria bacterium RIFOXYA2_FULL_38_14]OGK63740.1 MAG: hypothetical protein A3K27_03025 [Candidatus Roizmanbacteria bacterium RIFOXYA1_FULL_37_12]OGK65586.1 MAG: hypothetical protein A3K38_03025 [Candidatus Roizmanbacteria bacterium RIFOXYB1_FULL_40_23]OGK68370.1 MAG: hypothetical protein A2334_05905 [Candidatus Roizmanbacteria bacterium RIFOXYB2_FULL_38_10]OGK69991.1 MAG: hypothetical protein A3K21_03030 [Candidatus Roizmanbacteria ba
MKTGNITKVVSKNRFAISIAINISLVLMLMATLIIINRSNINKKKDIKKKEPYSQFKQGNKPYAYYLKYTQTTAVNEAIDNREVILDLPDTLIIAPGIYRVNNQLYDLQNEGLYRFIYPEVSNKQRIVYEKDNNVLLSSISWIVSHGNADDTLSFKLLENKAKDSKLSITCGTMISWTQSLLSRLGTSSRIVLGLTLKEWNTYDNGHTLLEVYDQGLHKWIVYDLDNNQYFSYNSVPLSFYEYWEHIKDDYQIIKLANDFKVDVGGFRNKYNNFDYSLLVEQNLTSEENLRSWYANTIQVPMIQIDGIFYHFDRANKNRVDSYNPTFKYIDFEMFMSKFYK